jgi:hypothetical protein
MPRPISWLPRIHAIRRSITESVRSHYGRKDLERLFELQPRSAQKLLELLPSIPLGRARYVEREALNVFLERLQKADDVPAALLQCKKERAAPRRVLRELLPRDTPIADPASLPSNVSASPGAITIHFTKMEELAGALATLANILTDDFEGFAQRYEPQETVEDRSDEQDDFQAMMAELEELERGRRPSTY